MRIRGRLFFVLCVTVLSILAGSVRSWAQPWSEQAKLVLPDQASLLGFSLAASADGGTIVVAGALRHAIFPNSQYEGAVFVFVRPAHGWVGTIAPVATLTASAGMPGNANPSVGITSNGDTVVVGAPGASDNDGNVLVPDAAYVFVRPPGGWSSVPQSTETARLTGSDVTATELVSFGVGVAVDGDTVVVGSLGTGSNRHAYVFVRPPAGWTSTSAETARLRSNGTLDEFLGFGVSIKGDVAVVGAPFAWSGPNRTGTQNGAAHIFVKPPAGWQARNPLRGPDATLVPPTGEVGVFGGRTAIDGDTIVVGAIQATVNGHLRQGVAYVFVATSPDWSDAQRVATLSASDGAADDFFGSSVAVHGARIATAKPRNGFGGAAYAFDMPAGGWSTMTETQQFVNPPGSTDSGFGNAVALSTDTLVVGAPFHGTYVFGPGGTRDHHSLGVGIQGTGTGSVVSDLPGIDCSSNGGFCFASFFDVDAVTLTATADPGSSFVGWTGDCSGNGPGSVTMDAPRSCTATFVAGDRRLEVFTSGPGTGSVVSDSGNIYCPSQCSDYFADGSVVVLTANADPGSTFGGWSGDCDLLGAVTMNAPVKRCTATFERTRYTLTVTPRGSGGGVIESDPAGINCGTACASAFDTGSFVTLTATPDPGSTFGGWSGHCSGAGLSALVSMDADKACAAVFHAALQSIAVTPPHPSLVVSSSLRFTATGTYTDGSTQDVTAMVAWASTIPLVATVDVTGRASGVNAGTTTISATLDGASGSTLLTVAPAPTTIAINSPQHVWSTGQLVTVTATVTGVAPTSGVSGVTFLVDNDANNPLAGTITLTPSMTLEATVSLGQLPVGLHTIAASYGGDANNQPSALVSLELAILDVDASGTAVRGVLTGSAGGTAFVFPRLTGNVGAESSLTPPVFDPRFGSASAHGFLRPSGPAVGASTTAYNASGAQSAARSLAYATYVNVGAQPVLAPADAIVDGFFAGAGISHVSAAVYVFERDAFLSTIASSGMTLPQFLLGSDTLNDYAAGTQAALSLAAARSGPVRQALFDATAVKNSAFALVSNAAGPTVNTRLTPLFTVNPHEAVIILFDLTVYSNRASSASFSATLKPGPDFLKDPGGNLLPLETAGLSSDPPAVAHLALTPAASTNVLATPTTVTATATTASGTPVPGALVFFDVVAGPNASPVGAGVTDVNGQATLTYSGGAATGTDQIQARVDTLVSNTASVTWTPRPVVPAAVQLAASARTVKNGTGQYVATITIKNSGGTAATGAGLVTAALNGYAGTPGATGLGDIPAGGSATVVETFPASAGTTGSANTLRLQVNWFTGSATISLRVALP